MSSFDRLVKMIPALRSAAAVALGATACSSYPHFSPDPAELEPAETQIPRARPGPPVPPAVLCQPDVPCELPGLVAYTESSGVTIELLGDATSTPSGFEPAPRLPAVQVGTPGKSLGTPLKAVIDLQGLRVEPKLVVLFDEGTGARRIPVEFLSTSAVLLTSSGGTVQVAHIAPQVPKGCEEKRLGGGDFDVSSLRDLSGVTHIKGDLLLTGSMPAALEQLSCLVEVTGDLTIRETFGLVSLDGLEALTIIGGALEVGTNSDLVRLALPSLMARTHGFSIASNAQLQEIRVPQLMEVQGNLNVSHNGAPTAPFDLELPSLEVVAGHVELSNNPGWGTARGLPSLREISGRLTILHNESLVDLTGLKALRSVGASLEIGESPALVWASGLGGLLSVGGNIDVHDCPRLRALELGHLGQVQGTLSVSHNGANAPEFRVNFSSLSSIEGDLSLDYNRAWTSADGLPSLRRIGGNCSIANNDDLLTLEGLESLESIDGQLSVTNNALLGAMKSFSALTTVGQGIAIHSNPALTEVDLGQLKEVNGPLVFAYNGATSSALELDLSSVITIWGRADFIYNGSWRLGGALSRLRKVAGSLSFFHDRDLNQISLPELEVVEGTLDISNDPQLTFVAFDGLEKLSGNLSLHSQDRLAVADFASLREISGSLNLSNVGTDGPSWAATFPKLVSVGNDLTMNSNRNWRLTDTLPRLEVVDGDVTLAKNTELMSISLPQLSRIGGDLKVTGNPALLALSDLLDLQELGGELTISDNPRLAECQAEALVDVLRERAWRNSSHISANAEEVCTY